ncbi:DUF6884 domain-containing protein, partial [Streptomyces sp. NPDC001178]
MGHRLIQESTNPRASPCSAAKLAVDRPTPARHLYTGSYHLMCRRAAERIAGPAGVLVLSALHGFVRLDDELLPYEQRMDTHGRIGIERLRGQAAELGSLAVNLPDRPGRPRVRRRRHRRTAGRPAPP